MEEHRNIKISGRVHKYGDNINTDVIIPARYCNTIDEKELAAHCMEDLDGEFRNKVNAGDILVAGENFGCGSSREVAPIAIKAAGISCIIACSFARIFYRNAINTGLYVIESPKLVSDSADGQTIDLEIKENDVLNHKTKKEYTIPQGDTLIRDIITRGGLVEFVKDKLNLK